jgi:hypothetical protein
MHNSLESPMTPSELISDLRACGPQSLSVTLHYIADRWCELTLSSGQRLSDATDSKAAFKELAEAAALRETSKGRAAA